MRISATVNDLSADLAALGSLGDQTMAEAARRLAGAMQAPLTARLLEALSQVAAELQAAVPDQRVELRLMGDEATLVVVPDVVPAATDVAPAAEAELDARITLRLPFQLKTRLEAASAQEGVSVNTYIVRALSARAQGDRSARLGRRLSGYGRS